MIEEITSETRRVRVDLTGRRALVTGGGRGIGRGVAVALAEAGADVAALARTRSEVEATAEMVRACGRRGMAATCDVRDPGSIEPLVAELWAELEGLDILVNAAGVSPIYRRAEQTSLEDWDAILETNLRGTFAMTAAVARQWLSQERPGSVVTVTSIGAAVGLPRLVAYNASKAGLASMTQTMALEWASKGIRVNAVGPAFVETELTAGMKQNPRILNSLLEKTPMARIASVDEVVGAVLFLVSDSAAYVTGQTIYVDGGWLAQ